MASTLHSVTLMHNDPYDDADSGKQIIKCPWTNLTESVQIFEIGNLKIARHQNTYGYSLTNNDQTVFRYLFEKA